MKNKYESRKQMGRQKSKLDSVVLSQIPVKQHTLTNSVTHTHVDNSCVCFQSDLRGGWGGVGGHPTEGHKTRISRSVLLILAATISVYTQSLPSLLIMINSAKKRDLPSQPSVQVFCFQIQAYHK